MRKVTALGLQAEHDRRVQELRVEMDRLQSELDRRIAAEYKRRFPRKKFKSRGAACEALGDEAIKKLREDLEPAAERARDERHKLGEKLNEDLRALAASVKLKTSDSVWTRVHVEDDADYRSMGYSKSKYARAAAEMYAEDVASLGFDVRVVRTPSKTEAGPLGLYASGGRWSVWINADAENAALVPYAPLPGEHTMEIEASRLWRKSVNPKVYFPFLPDDVCDRAYARRHEVKFGKTVEVVPAWS